MMGGQVTVQSLPGAGSCFTADLYVSPAFEHVTVELPSIHNQRIYIGVGNEEMAAAISRKMHALGGTPVCGSTPKGNLAADFDLFILEATPDLSLETLESALREGGQKALILSEPRAFRAGQGSDRTRMVRKPVKRDALLRAIADLMSSDGDRRGRTGGVAA
jgi:hypothetical protein